RSRLDRGHAGAPKGRSRASRAHTRGARRVAGGLARITAAPSLPAGKHDRLDTRHTYAGHPEFLRRAVTQVENAASYVRPAVVHAHHHALAILDVRHV